MTRFGHEARVFVAMHATDTPNLLYLVRDPWRWGEPLEATQVHHSARRYGGCVAALGTRAAAGFIGTAGPSRSDRALASNASHVKRVP